MQKDRDSVNCRGVKSRRLHSAFWNSLVCGCLFIRFFSSEQGFAQELANKSHYHSVPDGPAFVFRAGDGKANEVIEASAVEPLGDGKMVLVAHDKAAPLYVVELATGRIVGDPLTCAAFPEGLKAGPKWEGLARDEEGVFYAVGSHSGKTAEERRERAYLLRFKLGGDGSSSNPYFIAPESVVRWHIDDALIQALEKEGLDTASIDKRKIEGLAVRVKRDATGKVTSRELLIGLRNPEDLVRSFAADITESPGDGSKLALRRMFAFQAGKRDGHAQQLTSLEHVTLLGRTGFLILTATEDEENRFHGNALWFAPDDKLDAVERLWDFEPSMKVEGIAALPSTDAKSGRFVLTYDNDPHATHLPSRMQLLSITNQGKE